LSSYLIQRETPSLRNLICPTALNLQGNIVDAKYTTSGQMNLNGNIYSPMKVKIFSSQFAEIKPVSFIEKGGFLEIKIGGCGSN
jgi:hypothetical protein